MAKIAIVGGGTAGLSAGIYALKAGYDAEIIESHRLAGGKPDEIPIDSETFPTLGFKGGLSGSADTVFASDYSDVEAIYATWNGTEWKWATDETGALIVLPNEAAWPTVQIAYPEGVNGALLRLRFIPQGN